jgi:hypothetical protein
VKYHFLFVAVVIYGGSAAASPVVWGTASGGNGHAYEVVAAPGTISWDNARAAARARGGDLASITSAAENAFVFRLTDSTDYWWDYDGHITMGPWLGGFQPLGSPEPAGGWQWVSGEPFAYTNWAPGNPSNTSGEDRLHYFVGEVGGLRGPTWNDVQNNGGALPKAYVIEYPPPRPGDVNFDGHVDSIDLLAVRRHLGGHDAPWDVTGDGRVNVLDVKRVREEMRRAGATRPLASVVPDPSSLALLALACVRVLRRPTAP